MKIQMKVVMSGTRNGESWPLPGEEIEVPDDEGAQMCANGLAIPVAKKDAAVEKREKQNRAEVVEEQQDEAERQHVESHADSNAEPDAGPKRRTRKRETAK
jgi:hypothetical protein